WREPFGLVMVESMASGTPVIAMELGSTTEVIDHAKTGFLCSNVEECIRAIDKVADLDRFYCREYVQNRFSLQAMTDGYEEVYRQILQDKFANNGRIRSMVRN
uniref:glycosyltransferase n=1 Tax=Nostoc sp. CMAA1605 TaxID=2055159 RepID=UPI001F184A0B